jgi:putative ABC transport system substrate-binding protein
MLMGLILTRLVAGAVVLLVFFAPLAIEAQPTARMYQVAWLSGASANSDPRNLEAFRQALRAFGWVEGQNIAIEYRWAEGQNDRLAEMAAEVVRLKVDVIVAPSPGPVFAVKEATQRIPIVMVFGPDPVESRLVASLARPGGNITGLTSLSADLSLKQLELLKEMVPGLTRVAVLWNPTNPWHAPAVKRVEAAARALGLRLQVVGVRGSDEFDAAFAAMAKERAGAVLGLPDPLTFLHRTRLADLAAKHRLPTMNGLMEYTEAGGLASYWPNSAEMFRRAAFYVHRILSGAQAGDLAIEQPTTFELVVNLKTAKALGLRIPSSLLLRADRVIE